MWPEAFFCPASPDLKGHGGLYPPSPPVFGRGRELAVKGAERPAACGGLPLTARPGCAIPRGAAGVYPPEPPPFPGEGKGGGDRVDLTPGDLIRIGGFDYETTPCVYYRRMAR